jgi:hypothetical protein
VSRDMGGDGLSQRNGGVVAGQDDAVVGGHETGISNLPVHFKPERSL